MLTTILCSFAIFFIPMSAFALDGDAYFAPIGMSHLDIIKESLNADPTSLKNEIEKLKYDADFFLKKSPPSVMSQRQHLSGVDEHDYISYAPYWFPNPKAKNGLPFIRRDGHVYEKLRRKGDQEAFNEMAHGVQVLAMAFYYTENESYAVQASKFLRAWFFDQATKMNPNVEHGQIIMGRRNSGRRAGINEMRFLSNVLDSELLLKKSKSWTFEDHQLLVQWFETYFKWLTTSSHGKEESQRPNNHSTWFDVQYCSIAIFLGKIDSAKKVLEDAKELRIKNQMKIDGSFPLEIERASSLHYSLYNLTAMFGLATLAEKVDVDLWNYRSDDGRSIRKALDYLLPFSDAQKKWPYPELRDDESWHWPFLLSQAVRAYRTKEYQDALTQAEKIVNHSCTYCYRLSIGKIR